MGTAAILALASTAALALIAGRARKAAAAALASIVVVSAVLCAPWPDQSLDEPADDPLKVAIVQTNVPGEAPLSKVPAEARARLLARFDEQIRGHDLIVFPESGLPIETPTLGRSAPINTVAKEIASATQSASIFTAKHSDAANHRRFQQAAVYADPTGSVAGIAPKRFRIPLFETGLWSGLTEIANGGKNNPPVSLASGHRVAIAVCYDSMFRETFRDALAGGADFMVVLSNDSVVGEFGASLHRLRTLARHHEYGLDVLYAGATGLSGPITGAGIPWADAGTSSVAIHRRPGGPTLYARYVSGWFDPLSKAAAVAVVLIGLLFALRVAWSSLWHRRGQFRIARFALPALTIVSLFAIERYVIGLAAVSGPSMEPTLSRGEHVAVCRFGTPRTNDIVLFTRRGQLHVKRVVASQGETVTQADGRSVKVPAQSYYVLGDNRKASIDSRQFGLVRQSQIRGRVCL